MPEHRIQLRRIWDADYGTTRGTVDLPIKWPIAGIPHQLVRKFHAPRLRDPAESVYLVLEEVAGLVSASLNGHQLELPLSSGSRELDISSLLDRVNLLVLTLHSEEISVGSEWGRIALAIRS